MTLGVIPTVSYYGGKKKEGEKNETVPAAYLVTIFSYDIVYKNKPRIDLRVLTRNEKKEETRCFYFEKMHRDSWEI